MNEHFLGIDIGGTKTRIGLVRDPPGQVAACSTIPTLKDDPGTMMSRIAEQAALLAGGDLLFVGVGLPGPLDLKARRPGALPNLPGWRGFPVCETLESLLGVPVVMENDANVAALGEMAFGAGKGLADFIFVTLGTGIGGAVIAGGRLVSGARGGAGEIGHIQVDPGGPQCGCGRKGCVEAMASGTAIERAYGRPAAEVFALALEGDAKAKEVLTIAGRALGAGLAAAVTLLEPETVIFGGGMSESNPRSLAIYIDACRQEVEKRAYLPWRQEIPFIAAALGADAPVLGAALLARTEWEKSRRCGKPVRSPGLSPEAPGHTGAAGCADEPRVVVKPWGEELWWAQTSSYVGKRILVRSGHSLSLQYHVKKMETMFFVSGTGILVLGEQQVNITPGLSVTIRPGTRHRVIAVTDVVFFEGSTPEVDDVVRLEDAYGRAGHK